VNQFRNYGKARAEKPIDALLDVLSRDIFDNSCNWPYGRWRKRRGIYRKRPKRAAEFAGDVLSQAIRETIK
jgi:hypothetical protein